MLDLENYGVDYSKIPKERLSLAVSLILLVMHGEMDLAELALASGLAPNNILKDLNNLQRLHLITIIKKENRIFYKINNTNEALQYLEQAGIIQRKA